MPPTYDEAAVLDLVASYHCDDVIARRDNSLIRISGIHQCRRQLAYRQRWHVEGLPGTPMWSHAYATFDVGHGLHLRLQERLSNVGALGWVDGEPTIDEHGHFGFNGLFEVTLKSEEHRLRGTLDALTRKLKPKRVRVKTTGEIFETYQLCEPDDPEGKHYILDVKSITARDRYFIDTDPTTGEILRVTVKDSAYAQLVQPKDEHLGQTMLYSYFVTQPWFQHERLGGKPLETPPDVMVVYWAKDLDPKFYAKDPECYPDPKGILNGPFKIFTVPYDQKRVDQLLAKAQDVWSYLDRGELPPRDYKHIPSRPAWACVDCAFRQDCYQKEGYFANDPETEPARVHYLRRELEKRHEEAKRVPEAAADPAGATGPEPGSGVPRP